jgi:hypothetical protein
VPDTKFSNTPLKDIHPFDLISLKDFGRKIDRSYKALIQYVTYGRRPANWKHGDPLVKLKACKVAGIYHTCELWYKEFIEELNPP